MELGHAAATMPRVQYLLLLLLVLLAAVLAFQFDLLHRCYEAPRSVDGVVLRYAAVDLDEPRLRGEIAALLRKEEFNREFSVKWKPSAELVMRFRRHLSDWVENRRFDPHVMLETTEMLFHGRDGKSRFRSCAVVGNSGILLDQHHGAFIDAHEIVIRLNYAPTWGFERRVGTKTSISFVNSNVHRSCCGLRSLPFCNPYNPNTLTVMYICQPIHFFDYLRCNSSEYPVIITDPRFDTLCAQLVKYYSLKRFVESTGKDVSEWPEAHGGRWFHYSSGMQAVMLAVGICEKVSVLGFGKGGNAKHHYHDGQKSELSLHDFEAEYELYQDLKTKPSEIPFISDKFQFPLFDIY